MQTNYDNNQYKNFSFFKNSVSDPWANKQGTEMVNIYLSKRSKENLGIPPQASAYFNVAAQRINDSKFNDDMGYVRLKLDREINVYSREKLGENSYKTDMTKITAQQLLDSIKSKPEKDVVQEQQVEADITSKADEMTQENDKPDNNQSINYEFDKDDIEF